MPGEESMRENIVHYVETEDEVVELANATEFGLAGGVFTADLSRAHRVVDQLEAGTLWINTHNMLDPSMPFGGYKQSGMGREFGRSAIEGFTEVKSVCITY